MTSLLIVLFGWGAVGAGCVWLVGAPALIVWGAATVLAGLLLDWGRVTDG